MKKLFYGAVVALLIGAASCGKSEGDSGAKFFSETATDSLLTSFGEMVGLNLNAQISQMMIRDSSFTKKAFLKGLQAAMAADSSEAYAGGYMTGLNLQRQFKAYRQMGLDVDQRLVLEAIKKGILLDTVPSQIELQMIQGTCQMWEDSLMRAQRAYALKVKMTSEEALANVEKGKKFITVLKEENDSVQTTASGLSYKVISAGDEQKLTPTDRPIINIVGRTTEGRVFERDNNRQTRVNSPNLVAGLQEGLLLLGKGGKAVFYIPGELAFGVENNERYRLGLNEMVVYEVEVVDVASATPAAQGAPQGR